MRIISEMPVPLMAQYRESTMSLLLRVCNLLFSRFRYWDWSLDSSNFKDAPIWDSVNGIGGDGSGPDSVGEGKCVASGPFSDIEPMFYDGEVKPHCLSRGFLNDEEMKEIGELIRPESINDLMGEDKFDDFAGELEKRAHNFLTHSVRGDLSSFTGPNGSTVFSSFFSQAR